MFIASLVVDLEKEENVLAVEIGTERPPLFV